MKNSAYSNKKQIEGTSDGVNRYRLTSQTNSFTETPDTTANFRGRQEYLLVNSLGSEVIVTLFSGSLYSGILSAYNPDSKDGTEVVLKFPKVIKSGFEDVDVAELTAKLGDTLLLQGKEVAELELNNIDLTLDDKYEQTLKKKENFASNTNDANLTKEQEKSSRSVALASKFKTDVDISKTSSTFKERELQKWTPEVSDSLNINQSLEESSSNWDQFAVNEKKFGVKSTYDEHFYTTKIDKSHPEYQQRYNQAVKLAKEIESQGSSNIHVAEDRGHIVHDSGMDEEDKYSGVDRRGDELLASLKLNTKPTESKPNKYVPPTLRNQPHHIDPAIISSVTEKVARPMIKASQNTSSKPSVKPIEVKAENGTSVSPREAISHKSDSKASSPSPSLSNIKEVQIEDLKKFSQKFKVPFKVPEDMKDIVKKNQQTKESKSDSAHATSSKGGDGKRPSISSRRRHATIFFGSKGLPHSNNNKKAVFNDNFNMFVNSEESYRKKLEEKNKHKNKEEKVMEPFMLEKPYFTAPTWESSIEKSHKALFEDERVIVQKVQMRLQQRQMRSMNSAMANPQMQMAMGGMMGYPMVGGMNPAMSGTIGMYLPFQQQQMMYHSAVPQMMAVKGGNESVGMGSSTKEHVKNFSPQQQYHTLAYGVPGGMPGGNAYGYQGNMPFNQGMMGHGNANYKQNHQNNNNHYNRHNNGSRGNSNNYYYHNNNYRNNNNYNNNYRNSNKSNGNTSTNSTRTTPKSDVATTPAPAPADTTKTANESQNKSK